MGVTFIVHFKDGSREQYSTRYNENSEYEVDAAWYKVRMRYPNANYIERF